MGNPIATKHPLIPAIYILSTVMLTSGCKPEHVHEPQTIFLQQIISLPSSETVTDRIKNECNISTRLLDDIEYYAQKQSLKVIRSNSVSPHTPGKTLLVKITDLRARGGGHWTRGRYMHIEGSLWDRGSKIGSFIDRRESWSGNDACMSLAHVSRGLGEDVARWLVSPTFDARLGDTKDDKH